MKAAIIIYVVYMFTFLDRLIAALFFLSDLEILSRIFTADRRFSLSISVLLYRLNLSSLDSFSFVKITKFFRNVCSWESFFICFLFPYSFSAQVRQKEKDGERDLYKPFYTAALE